MERKADGHINTTQWEDVQYKHGNKVGKYVNHEIEIVAQKLAEGHEDARLEEYDPVKEKVQDKAERGGFEGNPDGEDEEGEGGGAFDDDDDALLEYRRRRMEQLAKEKETNKFGTIKRISGNDYIAEITEASNSCPVVAVMVKHGNESCDALLKVLEAVSHRQRQVKFVAVDSAEAIAKFPEAQLPLVLIYMEGTLSLGHRQLTGLEPWGGQRGLGVNKAEEVLRGVSVLPKEDEDDVHEDQHARGAKTYQTGLK